MRKNNYNFSYKHLWHFFITLPPLNISSRGILHLGHRVFGSINMGQREYSYPHLSHLR